MKKWVILNKVKSAKSEEVVKLLLANRGLKTAKQVKEFLSPPDPYTLTASQLSINSKEVEKAVSRIKKAIKDKEKIIIYGDYDSDGVCATAILWETLNNLGAKVMPFIPTREEGYGLKEEKIDQLKNDEIGLIITVDHGIIAEVQIEHAKKVGIDVIVTDHHLPGKKLPKALAIVHTTQICGAGVAWFLASRLGKIGLELITLGTITDVMPLLGVNRAIVKFGLDELRKTKIQGLLALFKTAGINQEKIGTYEIGFMIGPRLNASGRMEDAMDSLRLLCTKDNRKAELLAQKIEQQNKERRLLTTETALHARDLWLSQEGKNNLIFVTHESYEEGIIGLVAGKLAEEFYRPSIVVAQGEEYSRASARSISGLNIVEVIRTCADILGPHGGHPMAAGFTVETVKIEELRLRLSEAVEQQLNEEKLTPILKIDLELGFADLTAEFWQKLREFEPFGINNPQPVFLTRGIKVEDIRLLGNNLQHLKLYLVCPDSGLRFEAIAFGMGEFSSKIAPQIKVDVVYNFDLNEWNGRKTFQLKVKDLKISDK